MFCFLVIEEVDVTVGSLIFLGKVSDRVEEGSIFFFVFVMLGLGLAVVGFFILVTVGLGFVRRRRVVFYFVLCFVFVF